MTRDLDQLTALADLTYNRCIDARPIRSPYRAIAEAVIADGWRPPARVITDPWAADQLPAGAVVMNDGGQVAQRYDGMGGWWQVLDGDPIDSSAELIGTGSITVLHTPGTAE